MASIHYLKKARGEAVIKCYKTDSAGGTIDVDIANLATDDETFDANNAIVTIKEVYWGAKKDKQIDISRKERGASNVHGHYYLIGAGSYDFDGACTPTAWKSFRYICPSAFPLLSWIHIQEP